MEQFKIGDIVTGNDQNTYGITTKNNGFGVVTKVSNEGKLIDLWWENNLEDLKTILQFCLILFFQVFHRRNGF